MEDKLVTDYIFSMTTRELLESECRDVLYDLSGRICSIYQREGEVLNVRFTTQQPEIGSKMLGSHSLVMLGEEFHFCCQLLCKQRLVFVDFYICEMSPADQALIKMLVEKHLGGDCWMVPDLNVTLRNFSAILPETEDLYRRTRYEQLADTLKYVPKKVCHLELSGEDVRLTPDYILLTNCGYLIRHVACGEIRLSILTWGDFRVETFYKFFPEWAWANFATL